MSRTCRRATILVVLVTTGFLIWKYAPLQEVRWQGGREVTVRIESPQAVRKLRIYSVNRRDEAEHMVEVQRQIDPKDAANVFDEFKSKTFDPYDGEPVQILIFTGGASNQSGRDFRYTWFSGLIVVGEYSDGRPFQLIVDVPDPRVTRKITVRLP